MKKQTSTLHIGMILILLTLQACNLPSAASPQATEIDPLVAAQMTITAAAELLPTVQSTLTFTPFPTLSSTPASSVTPAFTSTPTFAYITLSEATNCRIGPGLAYDLVDTFLVGQTIEVIGKHPFDNYWYVRSPRNQAVNCWLWGFYATGANLSNVPILTPPPSPTPVPVASFTAAYVNSGQCIGWWSRINLTNTGPVAFKSMSISLKDTVTNETRDASGDGFQDVSACVLSAKAPTLGPGDAYTIVTPSLSADPTGHRLSATIKLCANIALGGSCTSQTIEFTP